jgi:hypothetical protein
VSLKIIRVCTRLDLKRFGNGFLDLFPTQDNRLSGQVPLACKASGSPSGDTSQTTIVTTIRPTPLVCGDVSRPFGAGHIRLQPTIVISQTDMCIKARIHWCLNSELPSHVLDRILVHSVQHVASIDVYTVA